MLRNKLLIFDCDGTLVDSEGIANQVFISGVQELGIPITEEEAWQHFPGTSMALCIQYVEEKFEVKLPSSFIPEQRSRQKIEFRNRLRPIEGVPEMLPHLKHTKCVASNGPYEIILDNLTTTNLASYFTNIFSAYIIQKWKPMPDLFLIAAQSMGFHPSDCIVIEDSYAGLQAGLNAGMTVLAFRPPSHTYQPYIEGVIPFQHMSDLPTLIDKVVGATPF